MKCASFCESEDEQQRQKELKREEADYARSLRFEERNKYRKKVYWNRPAPPEEQRQAQRMQPHIPDANSDRRNRNTSHDVYAEGYDAGYEAGEDDGASGCGRYITNMTNQIIILQTRLMNMKQVMKMDIRMATMQNVMMMTESL